MNLRICLTIVLAIAGVGAAPIHAGQPVTQSGDLVPGFDAPTDRFDYDRQEVMIPMRDGVKLHTVIVRKRGVAAPMPILLSRTPYGAKNQTQAIDSTNGASTLPNLMGPFFDDGYILAFQDIRGRNGSEGDYVLTRPLRGPFNQTNTDESTDAWDTIDWLVKNLPNNNGRVGILGTSYVGLTTLEALIDPHPALRAAVPMNPMVDGWIGDDFYHNGAFRQGYFDWMFSLMADSTGSKDPAWGYYDLYDALLSAGSAEEMARQNGADKLPAWRRIIDNDSYNAYWRDQALEQVLSRVSHKVPVLTVHGLFDQEDNFGGLAAYRALEARDSDNRLNFLVLGPWSHGQSQNEASSLGAIKWGADTGFYFRTHVLKPFLDTNLRDIAPSEPLSPVLAFQTGANEWRRLPSWPSSGTPMRLYLRGHGRLGFSPGTDGEDFAEYVSDPAKPVPYRLRPIRPVYASDSSWSRWLVDDQRFAETRPDVLTFVSDVLDKPVSISGPVSATLFASTTGTDSDWVVKLIDVYPPEVRSQPEMGGYELMVSADIMRGRYRESTEIGKPVKPGAVMPYKVRMPDANHRFLPGHRIMVQVQSSWFPLYDRNPQTFVANRAKAHPADFRAAHQRIYLKGPSESFVEVLAH